MYMRIFIQIIHIQIQISYRSMKPHIFSIIKPVLLIKDFGFPITHKVSHLPQAK